MSLVVDSGAGVALGGGSTLQIGNTNASPAFMTEPTAMTSASGLAPANPTAATMLVAALTSLKTIFWIADAHVPAESQHMAPISVDKALGHVAQHVVCTWVTKAKALNDSSPLRSAPTLIERPFRVRGSKPRIPIKT